MRITVRTIVRLGGHLATADASTPDLPGSPGIRIARDTTPGATPSEVIRELGLSSERTYLVKVNGRIVPQTRHATTRLRDGDEVTILPKPKYG